MTIEDIENAAKPPEQYEGVTVEEEESKAKTFTAKYFRVKIKTEKLDDFKNLDPVAKMLEVTDRMKLSKRRLKKQGILSVPDGAYDIDRQHLYAALSEW